MLEKFNIAEVKLVTILLTGHLRLSSSQYPNSLEEKDEMSRVSYVNVVG